MTQPNPMYEALDHNGRPVLRPARIIGELPSPGERAAACNAATIVVAQMLGLPVKRKISFGLPVSVAFMSAPEARKHPQRVLLETRGCDIPLDLCDTQSWNKDRQTGP